MEIPLYTDEMSLRPNQTSQYQSTREDKATIRVSREHGNPAVLIQLPRACSASKRSTALGKVLKTVNAWLCKMMYGK